MLLRGTSAIPRDEPAKREQQEEQSQSISPGTGNPIAKSLGAHKEEGGAHSGHKKRGDECHPEAFLFLHQIDSDGPQGEACQGLVTPSKPVPKLIEAIGVSNLPGQ